MDTVRGQRGRTGEEGVVQDHTGSVASPLRSQSVLKKKKLKPPGHVDRSDDSTAVRILTVGFLLPLRFHVSHREKWEELRVDDVALYRHKNGGGGRGRGVWKKYDVSL